MSRYYEMSVEITGCDKNKVEEISEVLESLWTWDDWEESGLSFIRKTGKDFLCGGMGEEEFAAKLARQVWKTNGAFCEVDVCATFLEELPFERYTFDEDEYEDILRLTGGENE
jgi:hypothetical protein